MIRGLWMVENNGAPVDLARATSTNDPAQNSTEKSSPSTLRSRIGFAVFMLLLTGLFAYLGNWQSNRLVEKTLIIATIDERINNAPMALPPVEEWVGFDDEIFNYRPVVATGVFDHANTIRVFTSLQPANGEHSGPGYWVVAPFKLEGGGSVLVNRGFVPQRLADQFETGGVGPQGLQTISGIARQSERANAFTPGPDYANGIEWVRNIERLLAIMRQTGDATIQGNFLPIYIDQIATASGALPQGGETRVNITNRHWDYMWTWFAFAIMTPFLLVYWLWRETKT